MKSLERRSSCYDGDGTVVYRDSCHKWHIDSLCHCSCYGPCHGGKEILSYLSDQSVSIKKENDNEREA